MRGSKPSLNPNRKQGTHERGGADRRTSGWRNAADGGREERPAEGRQRRIRKDGSGRGPPGICKGDQPFSFPIRASVVSCSVSLAGLETTLLCLELCPMGWK